MVIFRTFSRAEKRTYKYNTIQYTVSTHKIIVNHTVACFLSTMGEGKHVLDKSGSFRHVGKFGARINAQAHAFFVVRR